MVQGEQAPTFDDANFFVDWKHFLHQVGIFDLGRHFRLDLVDVGEESFRPVRDDRLDDRSLAVDIFKERLNVYECRTIVPCIARLVIDNSRERNE